MSASLNRKVRQYLPICLQYAVYRFRLQHWNKTLQDARLAKKQVLIFSLFTMTILRI